MAQTMRALSNTTDMKTASVRAPQRPVVVARSCRMSRQQNKQQMGAMSSCMSLAKPQQMERSAPIVRVAAQEAPAAQQTSTKVGYLSNRHAHTIVVNSSTAAAAGSACLGSLPWCACCNILLPSNLCVRQSMLAQTLPKPDMDPVCCPAVDRPGGECRVLLQ